MDTGKLFYEDSHLCSFHAAVTGCTPTDKGYAVTLEATAFYPEGGGQACDVGTLGGAAVLDVRERDGQIIHLCDRALAVGETVEGRVDWERRFDLMQQHSGEHIVSGIIHRRFGYHNVGFHMGSDMVTIDFDGPIPDQALGEIEQEANRAVWQNIPVRAWYPSEEALPTVPYRAKRALPWPVRVLEIPGYDTCACCGTHVKQTGEIGIIKLFTCVKFHQGVRIEMACGGRALTYLSNIYEQNRLVSQAFSAKVLQTGAAAQRMNEQLAAEKFRAAGLERQVFDAIAAGYRDAGTVLHFARDLEPGAVRELADRISLVCGGTACVFSGSDEEGYRMCLCSKCGDIKALGAAMAKALGARGGGKPGFFQGSVMADASAIRDFFAGQ